MPRVPGMSPLLRVLMIVGVVGTIPPDAVAQQPSFAGSAMVRMGDGEYTVVILCDDSSRPEMGFRTEPNRVTRQATGRTNGVNLRLRAWKETNDVVVSLDQYVAWIPRPAGAGGILDLEIEMSRVSELQEGMPVQMTYERWNAGERFGESRVVTLRAICGVRDPEAPRFRKIPSP